MAQQFNIVNGTPGTDAPFEVVDMVECPGRFEIVDKETGEIIDNANGYGYKNKTNAYRAGWYKFGGGKRKVDDSLAWWRLPEHQEFLEWIADEESSLKAECKECGQSTAGLDKYLSGAATKYASEHHLDDYKVKYFKTWKRAYEEKNHT